MARIQKWARNESSPVLIIFALLLYEHNNTKYSFHILNLQRIDSNNTSYSLQIRKNKLSHAETELQLYSICTSMRKLSIRYITPLLLMQPLVACVRTHVYRLHAPWRKCLPSTISTLLTKLCAILWSNLYTVHRIFYCTSNRSTSTATQYKLQTSGAHK